MYGNILKAYLTWDFYEVKVKGQLAAFYVHCFVLWSSVVIGSNKCGLFELGQATGPTTPSKII